MPGVHPPRVNGLRVVTLALPVVPQPRITPGRKVPSTPVSMQRSYIMRTRLHGRPARLSGQLDTASGPPGPTPEPG